ncbi:metallophosphatase family protein [Amylibacter sp.]|nr:metallophosphatase family protein [Amylibacter sp.]
MKIAFISDIHSNIEAFQAVLKFLETKKINQIYIAGDLIGYYYYAAEVINLCMSSDNIFCIQGNHDRNFLNAVSNEHLMKKLTSKYGSAYKKTKDQLSPSQINWLRALPSKLTTTVSDITLTVAHESVDNDDIYIYPDASSEVLSEQILDSDITVLGHTHHSFIWCKDNKYLLNPGSVGQPRDQSSLASILVLDTSNRAVIPYKVKCGFNRLKNDILKFDPDNKYLIKVLER